MNYYTFLIATATVIFLTLVISIMYFCFRKKMKEKNFCLFHQLKEQNRLEKELERSNIEKELLVKILNDKITVKSEINK